MTQAGDNHYTTLGIDPSASQAEVNAAFRRLAREFHPDRFAGRPEDLRAAAEAQFKRISVAFEVLREPSRRREYDRVLSGEAPAKIIDVRPATVVVRSAAGAFTLETELISADGTVGGQLDVRCDDPGVELTGLQARSDPVSGATSITIRGRVIEGGSRTMLLLYTVGVAAAAQVVELRVAAPGLRDVGRSVSFNRFGGFWGWFPYAVTALGIALVVMGAALYAGNGGEGASFAIAFGASLALVGVILLARNWVIIRYALEGPWRWVVFIGTFFVIRIALTAAREVF
jgi:hypothetical protein